MKRLRYYILSMKPTSESYEEMYEGEMYETFIDKDPFVHNHAVYWDGEIGYEIDHEGVIREEHHAGRTDRCSEGRP